MKQQPTFSVRITFAWWLTWLYLPGVMTLCLLGFEPNAEKIAKAVGRAVRIKIIPFPGIRA